MSDQILDSTDSLAELDRESLTMAVGELLEQHGWQTELALDILGVDVDRIATRAGERRLLRTVPADAGPVTASMVTAATNTVEKADANGLFLVSVADVTDAAQVQAEVDEDITLVDVETAPELKEELAAVCGVHPGGRPSSESPSESTQTESGASPDMVEAAVADVGDESDDDSEPDGSEFDDPGPGPEDDPLPESTSGDTTDDEISESVRGAERRIIVGELLLQAALALAFLVCLVYVVFRLGQVLV